MGKTHRMALLDTLLGGGLALAGAVGVSQLAARRDERRGRRDRRREALRELLLALGDVLARSAVARSGDVSAVERLHLALVRLQTAAQFSPIRDFRDRADALRQSHTRDIAAGAPDKSSEFDELMRDIGDELRRLDDS